MRPLILWNTWVAAAGLLTSAPAETPSAQSFGAWGFDVGGKDSAVKPGDDFYDHANGCYLARTEIPGDLPRYGVFDVLATTAEEHVRQILVEAAKDPRGADAMIGAFYSAYMDENGVEELGIRPLAPALAELKALRSHAQLAGWLGRRDGLKRALFGVDINPDEMDPSRYVVYLHSGGLGMPDRNYFLKPAFAATKTKYLAYIQEMLELVAWPEPAQRAREVLEFETRLAEASWEKSELRDRVKTYNPMLLEELGQYAPGYDFKGLLAARGLGKTTRVVVSDKSAFAKKAAVFAATPLPVVRAWAAFGVADASAGFLSRAMVDAHFRFHGRTLSGQPEQRARWKRGVVLANGLLGEAVGRIYVQRHFPPESKRQMVELVEHIRSVFSKRVEALEWMGEATKKAAQAKLAQFTVKIGYPDEFRDYAGLEIRKDDLYGNVVRAAAYEWQRQVDRIDGPVDRKEWGMPPQKVNAYYNSSFNEIVFPAAILQPPFFNPMADPAVNYGAIGGVIAHELSHGFDDQGRKSDGRGVLNDWWTKDDAERFNQRARQLGAQYEKLDVMPGERINAQLTMGENIGDLGGLTIALDAYRTSLNGKPAPVLDGTTGDQRVFFGWAQVWRQKMRDEALRKLIHTDPHPPAKARVNGVVRNIDAWYEAFDVNPGDKLYLKPEERVRIW